MDEKLFHAFGHLHGYPWGVTKTITAATIEEAHEEAESMLDDVVTVTEIPTW